MAIGLDKPPVALIAGATASGKSALALALAEATNGVVVNADSAQVYRELPILSASPSDEDRARAEHRLYNFRDATEPCSAAEWAEVARNEIDDLHSEGRLPILVGGTGLYIRTLIDGIAPVPPIGAAVRQQVRSAPLEANRTRLIDLDPQAAARLNASDAARISRALEVVLSTGRTLADWQSHREGGIGDRIALRPLILLPPRDWLYARCDQRFAAMLNDGAIEEVKALLERALPAALPAMQAIGVPQIADFLAGEISREEALTRGQQATRNYAKRQYTWFAHQPPADWPRFTEPVDNDRISDALALLGPKS